MKILSISTELKHIPLKTPFITALRRVDSVEYVRVTLRCENGLFAYGEAPATKAVTGEDIPSILSSVKKIKHSLLFQTPKDALKLLHASHIGSSAKAAIDMACVSLLAQANNKELYEYFQASDFSPIHTAITISLKDPHAMLADAKKAFDGGMWILKVKLGSDIAHAIEVVKSISQNIKGAKILVDANQAWHVQNTLKFIDAVKDLDIELIEQPVAADDLSGLKKITAYSEIPILADEAVYTLDDVKNVTLHKCADMINIKLMKCGGVTKAIEILDYARENRIECMLGSMLEGPCSINTALHLAFAYRDVIRHVDLDSPLLCKGLPGELDFDYNGCAITLKADKLH
ncbi:dipeptide epimerase [bacterium]|nr:dipeptide epimerase [bacterium]